MIDRHVERPERHRLGSDNRVSRRVYDVEKTAEYTAYGGISAGAGRIDRHVDLPERHRHGSDDRIGRCIDHFNTATCTDVCERAGWIDRYALSVSGRHGSDDRVSRRVDHRNVSAEIVGDISAGAGWI